MNDSVHRLAAALSDRYRIERELGQGGMATVYLAEDIKHDRKVALKVLKPELAAVIGAERFVVEIKTTAALQHPHILPLFDSGTADSFLYYVMPFIDGETLRAKLDRETQVGIDDAVGITMAVADALDYAHHQGVIHRDIKPENILLHNGRPMVADFGIALALSAAAGGRMTETGMSLGTPHYMSPEQATAEKEITARSDVYSLASVLYEMLTGAPPHLGGSAQQIIMKIVTEEAAPVIKARKSVPPNVAAAVAQALEKLPADRFDSAKAFADALSEPSFTRAGTAFATATELRHPTRARLVPLGIAVGLGMAAASLAFLFLRGEHEAPPVVRFQLHLPPNQTLDEQFEEDAPFDISPDGRRIVYVAIDSASRERRLFVRGIDQLEGTPLQGTIDPTAPFFSPDGLWIGFFSDDDEALRKIPVTGGPAITLADNAAPGYATGSWGDDGYIIYTSEDWVLSRVAGAGGTQEQLVSPDSSLVMLWPSVLPGGEAVLFMQCRGGNCDRTDLAVLDITTRSIEVVVPGATRGWYMTGHLIYATAEGAVYAVPFDPAQRAVEGSPIPVLDHVLLADPGGARLALSPSGSMMYLKGVAAGGLQVVDVDRSGRETVVIDRLADYRTPRWSPTRDRIALALDSNDGTSNIWVYDIGSETLTQLTSVGRNIRPSWSPDGRMIVFASSQGDSSGLHWIPADGSGPAEPVAPGEPTGGTTFWTRDGAWIVYDGQFPPAKDEDVFAVGTGADRAIQTVVATPATEESGAVSPDGRWIAYVSSGGANGEGQVFIRPFLTPGGRWLVSTGTAFSPLWASNTELMYFDVENGTLSAARLEFGSAVRVVERTPLFSWSQYLPGGRSTPQYDVSRDGQHILALRRSQAVDRLTPIVVLNWFDDVTRLVSAQGGTGR